MNPIFLDGMTRIGFVITELVVGFGVFWIGQLAYQKLFRRMDLNLELFVRDNPAVAIALVGYNFGIILALAGVLDKEGATWLDQLLYLASYGAAVILLMLMGAWAGTIQCGDRKCKLATSTTAHTD